MSSVKQTTLEPLIKATIVLGTQVYTDEYAIYNPLPEWGYKHKTVCHGAGEYARDDDGDGFCEVHVNTMEGFWSLLSSEVASASWHFSRKATVVLGFLRVCSQRQKER